ncbi:hypothetical protein BDA99DRAFT_595781 [Phascolomyces articulosus]|uniref:Uncharacterized protein n=1 Tax=Phascolomyces articulosus TaxID=60185 RepID=A0AAD5K587_9FUNG|nr:hypothetical protein BDA99DRAFT_595781 [Phascolomyces articulosus]
MSIFWKNTFINISILCCNASISNLNHSVCVEELRKNENIIDAVALNCFSYYYYCELYTKKISSAAFLGPYFITIIVNNVRNLNPAVFGSIVITEKYVFDTTAIPQHHNSHYSILSFSYIFDLAPHNFNKMYYKTKITYLFIDNPKKVIIQYTDYTDLQKFVLTEMTNLPSIISLYWGSLEDISQRSLTSLI